ncbi:hypothetical protein GCM10008018_18470 [Paenibacillus marchantiophytorum]|uniref:Uncharacterized protein n=1 Tax=Paenibacillus marchantiophytorum TaxID=1619310 RepID=A0ABQ2BX67_9BACL|nr:hypothetical protein GCM10008018_18470 [Paenibacillus marchantiophytorum]
MRITAAFKKNVSRFITCTSLSYCQFDFKIIFIVLQYIIIDNREYNVRWFARLDNKKALNIDQFVNVKHLNITHRTPDNGNLVYAQKAAPYHLRRAIIKQPKAANEVIVRT